MCQNKTEKAEAYEPGGSSLTNELTLIVIHLRSRIPFLLLSSVFVRGETLGTFPLKRHVLPAYHQLGRSLSAQR